MSEFLRSRILRHSDRFQDGRPSWSPLMVAPHGRPVVAPHGRPVVAPHGRPHGRPVVAPNGLPPHACS